MLQSTVWKCIEAQTELAKLTETLPPEYSYNSLVTAIKPKTQKAPAHATDIYECLLKRGVRLSTAAGGSNSTSAAETDADGAGAATVTAVDASTASVTATSKPTVVFLFDIEGTTTPLPFVRQVMMPLAAASVEAYAAAHFPSDAAFVKHVAAAAAFVAAKAPQAGDASAGGTATLADAFTASTASDFTDESANASVRALFCAHFKAEMSSGSKEPYMKAVQGAIWEEVFASGRYQTQVFPDVNEFFRYAAGPMQASWRIAIYSTGSIAAQKLIFAHTPYGDLNPCITAYFDPTTVGTKLTPRSYMRIRSMLAAQLKVAEPENLEIVFFTDNTSEASAADASGAIDCPVLCIRPLNEWITFDTMMAVSVPFVTSFTQLIRPAEKVDYKQMVQDTFNALKMDEAT